MTRQLKENLATGGRWIVSKRYGGTLSEMVNFLRLRDVTARNFPHRTIQVKDRKVA